MSKVISITPPEPPAPFRSIGKTADHVVKSWLAAKRKRKTVIVAMGPVCGPHLIDEEYVAYYNPSANDGRGDATFSKQLEDALCFNTLEEAMICASQIPSNRPLRADGTTNRPLMNAFSLHFREIVNGGHHDE